MHYCSLRTNERKQVSVSLHNVHIQHSNSTKDDSNDDSNKNVTSLDKLHTYMESHLDWKSTSTSTSTSGSASDPPVHLRFSEDAGLLKCAKPVKMEEDPKFTIFGVSENQSLFSRKSSRGSGSSSGNGSVNDSGNGSDGQHDDNPYVMTKDDDLRVIVEEYKPSAANVIEEEIKGANMVIPKNVYAPHYDWSTRTRTRTHTGTSRSHNGNIADREAEATATATLDNSPSTSTSTCKSTRSDECDTVARADARIKFIDLSALQKWRRDHCKPNGEFFAMNSPAAICYFLRSVLKYGNGGGDSDCIGEDGEASAGSQSSFGNHSSSPWRDFCALDNNANANTNTQTNGFDYTHTPESDHTDQVIAILLSNRVTNVESSRPMGDKYFWDELEELEIKEFEKFRTGDACPNFYLYSTSGFKGTFNVSDMLHGNKNEECDHHRDRHRDRDREHIRSSLTMLVYRQLPPRLQFQKRLESSEEELMDGCLWEKLKSSVEDEDCNGDGDDEQRTRGYRMVSPPYQNISDVCGDILQTLTSNENLKILTDEAKRIPQWTAWPEKTHYQSEYDDDESNIDSAYPASWTVFPLCHTFPASDVSKRKFIPLTCSYTPKTTAMLKSLGPKLRTALFSRLEPRTKLGAHTGWADLANHILRVHIPLSVPKGIDNAGLCGCWVDGCVETHEDGRIISFDDSKTHRAFNYTEEERIVLIVDLERPLEKFPVGTATGGHTNELEGFINQFT